MRADFGKGGEQVCRSRKAGVGNQMPGEYIRNGTMFSAKPMLAGCGTVPRSHRSCACVVGGPPCPHKTGEKSTELALLELDASKLHRRVEAALRTIQHRSLQKKETLSRKEREEIGNALRALVGVMRRRGA